MHHNFKLGKLWIFKHFFDNKEPIKAPWIIITKTYTASSSNPLKRENNVLKVLDQSFLQIIIFHSSRA